MANKKSNKTTAPDLKQRNIQTTAPKNATNKTAPAKQKQVKKANQWREEPGVDEPIRIGRAMRTRDNNFKGQKNKVIHPEQPKDELYRRIAVVDIDDDNNVAVVQVKRNTAKNGKAIPHDKQGRKYIPDILTLDDDNKPIKKKKGKFEPAPTSEDLTVKQAQMILSDI